LDHEDETASLKSDLERFRPYIIKESGFVEVTRLTPEAVEFLREEVRRQLKSQADYSNAFYMGAGLSAFAGILGYAYFGGYLGLLLGAAAIGPFLMSVLGLYYSGER